LLRLASYISNNRSFVYKISSGERVDTAYNVYPFGTLSNFNTIAGLEGFIGGKVGKTTAAKETILSVYSMEVKGEKRKIAFIVLGSNDNYKAVQQLYAYMEMQYGAKAPVSP
jgi:D-alanyl-D-alanine carboxypeptidase